MGEPKLRIAILGTRGIPARYGGFETFAEELSVGLVERGYEVMVYGRRRFGEKVPKEGDCRGVRTICCPTFAHKYLETPVHALTSFIDLFWRKVDVALLCNAANSPFAFLVKCKGIPLLINVDGIERERGKWNALGRLWYHLGEYASTIFATRVVSDAKVIADYYRAQYGVDSEVIAYGARAQHREPGPVLQKFGLRPRGYILYVSRLEPENNALGVIEAYRRLSTDVPLLIVGDAPYATEYKSKLHAAASSGVIFAGFQFGDAYQELQSNCLCYIQATEVGGTHPALVESMAYGNAIIANQTPENVEVLGDAGLFYSKNNFTELAERLGSLLSDPTSVHDLREKARSRANAHYRWDAVTSQYEELFGRIAARTRRGANP